MQDFFISSLLIYKSTYIYIYIYVCTDVKYFILKCCFTACVGGMSARAAREKMYEHGSTILAKSSSSSRVFHEKDLSVDSTAQKSGEVEADMKPKGKKSVLVLRCMI